MHKTPLMQRKDFLKGIGMVGISSLTLPLINACKKTSATASASGSSSSSSGSCSLSPTETAGPFPTSIGDPAFAASTAYVRTDITDGETGVPLTVKVIVRNTNDNCNIVSGAFVEIWHCNKYGYYSEFGPSNSGGMQTADMTSLDFLRGKQLTDSTGTATFLSIYPGWYSSRAPHIHVHIYNANGVSKLITQIAFIETVSSTVYSSSLYASHGQADTSNAKDNVFSDSISSNLCDSLTGSVSAGYTLTKTIYAAF